MTYLVIGGSSGIGLALTKQLAQGNNEVFVGSRTGDAIQNIPGVTHIQHDITTKEPINLPIEELDGLVYCPGSINLKPFHRIKTTEFEDDFQLNVMGAIKVIQQTLPLLKKSSSASIVLFSTIAVNQGMSFHSSVSVSKGAIEGLTKSLAAELAPAIRVNAIAPSIVDTPLAQKLLSTPEKKEASSKRHPLQSVGSAENLAEVAEFLLTQPSRWMTGQVIGVDGGLSTIKML